MNLQTYLALKAVVEADFEKLIFYQAVSDIDPPNYAIKSIGPAALITLTDAAAVPADSIKIDFEPIQEDDPEPPHSYSGSFVSFSSKKQVNAEDVLVSIEPVQAGSGDPSPDNVRPISGWTGEKVTRTGKAVWGGLKMAEAFVRAYQYSLDTTAKTFTFSRSQQNAQGSWKLDLFNCPDGIDRLTYLFTYSNSGMNRSIVFDYSDGTQIQFQLPSTSGEKATLFGQTQAGKTIVRIQLNYYTAALTTVYYDETTFVMGDVAREDMEPYQGDTYDIAFPTEAGAVYGGTLDVTKGVLTVDRAQISSYAGETLPGTWISDRDVYVAGATPTTGAQVVYELAAPVTYTLTPQQIALLRGGNTLCADTGDVKVDTPLIPAPISDRTGIKLYHSGSTQNMPDLIEVDWEDEVGTVYGGTLDIVSGVLTVDRATETITKDSTFYSFSVGTVNAIASVDFTSGAPLYVSGISSYNGAISSTFVELQNYWTSGRINETPAANYGFAHNSTGRCCFRIMDTSIATLADFKAAFPDTQVCYKLATPITHHLSPTQVNMLLGANTLWSDDGKVTLVYKAKK